jgi:transcriptional regulator with GAF, ATPase, and Fis domain
MGQPIWYQFVPRLPAGTSHRAIEQLSTLGLNLREEPAPIGLIFFDQDGPGLLSVVDAASRETARLLVVGIGETPPSAASVWRLMQAGAADVSWWNSSREPGEDVRARILRWQAIEDVLQSSLIRNHLSGSSPRWVSALRRLIEIAQFSAAPCLIQGESGTGKEVAARLIHTLDGRTGKKELVVVDCSTIVPELSGSEFFGHERGAYTGAFQRRDGAFALADGGTLLLDEAGELPPSMQSQLLRVIQEGTYKPVGGNEWRRTSFRLVSATNRDLGRDVNLGRFRGDLYYRMAGSSITLPALRERKADVLPLAVHFAQDLHPAGSAVEFDDAVKAYLLSRDYPGNVRELRQIVTRMCERHCGGGPITLGDVADEDRPQLEQAPVWHDGAFEQSIRRAVLEGVPLKEIGRRATESAIQVAIDNSGGNLPRAARRLGVTDRALQIRRAAQREDGNHPGKARSAGA